MFLRSETEHVELGGNNLVDILNTSEDHVKDVGSVAGSSAYSHSYPLDHESQMTGEWTASSQISTGLGTALTSLTDNAGHKVQNFNRPIVAIQVHRLKLPRPPEPNSFFEGREFQCPYCYHGLLEVYSFSSWK